MIDARKFSAALALGLLVAGGYGCADDAGGVHTADNNGGRITEPTETPGNGQLLHLGPNCTPGMSECVMDITMGSALDARAQLLDANGQPVENALISFEGNFGSTELSLSSASAYTDADGIAKVTVFSGESVGTGELIARTDKQELGSLKWLIGVSSKGAASYKVSFTHEGSAQIRPIATRLFPATVTCERLATNPNQTAVLERDGLVDGAGVFPTIIFPDRPNGDAYTVAAWASSLNYNGQVEVAYGCKDNNPPIDQGRSVEVVVDLVDHMPNIVGTFDVVHEFDLVGALPPAVQTIINLIGRLTNDPGSFVVGCPTNSTDPNCPSGSDGIINILVDFLPAGGLKDAIEGFLNSGIGNAMLRDMINELASNWLDNNAPPWVGGTVTVTGDIVETLQHFRVEGTMHFTEAPEVSVDPITGNLIGVLPANSGKQTWNDFVFNWRQGCTDTGPGSCTRRFGSSQLSAQPVVGSFGGTLLGADQLQINQHTLTLNYGALLVAVIEKVVLPEIFRTGCGSSGTQACDSINGALGALIKCPNLAEKVAGNTSGSVYNIVENLCTTLLNEASDKLRDYASTTLVASGQDVFLIGTPINKHCTLIQPEVYQPGWPGNPYPYIQYLGKETPAELQCKWEAKIRFSEDNITTLNGIFWGERRE